MATISGAIPPRITVDLDDNDFAGGGLCAGHGPKTGNVAADADCNRAAGTTDPAACPHCGAPLRRGMSVTTAPDGTLRVTCCCGKTVGMDFRPYRVWRLV